ncbi:MAG: glycoside hydrolase family 2 TIM barrel-domain containing protein [Verrucomicrobiota bacterium]
MQVQDGNTVIDARYQRFGWRQFTVRGKDFLLNGQPITLKGDSWHFMGVPQMTRRYAYAWYQLLKDAGANSVRLHASIYPSFYNDMADEMGIMVLAESAIWLSDGGPKADSELFWKNCRTHVESLVRRDRNHPSVFGWSICNEVLAVMRNVWHMPKNMIDDCLGEMSGWVKICETNDPTRGFISGDGEFDAEGRIPTINIHYGGEGELRRAADSGKPWGVGETSMAYYGTPKQVAKFNGDRAYESPLDRMEGLAYECYSLLHDQQRFGGNYQSVFNIAWYGVQPLPLGKENVTKSISSDEGVFFAAYREGVPGLQPERLGPYTTTLNPGFDSKLPLYRPWPMLEAIRDANTGNTNSRWAKMPVLAKAAEVAAKTNGTAMLRFLLGNGERLAQQLNRSGAKIEPYASDDAEFLLLDARTNQLSVVKEAVQAVLEKGGTIWAWNVQAGGAEMLSQLIGGQVVAETRSASSLVVKQPDSLLAGVDNASLYFAEGDDWQQVSFTLGGEFLNRGKVLLEACPAEWRRWNYKAEPVKTAALFRSEVENPGALAAVVVCPVRHGRVILCNLSPEIRSERKADLVRRLFLNAGIQLGEGALQSGFVDSTGQLMRALVVSGPVFTNDNQAYTGKLPDGEVGERARFDGRRWSLRDADAGGVFDFKSFIRSEQDNTVAYPGVLGEIVQATQRSVVRTEPAQTHLHLRIG